MSKIGYNSRRRVEKEMMISLSSRSNNACTSISVVVVMSFAEIINPREFVRFVQSASKVELNNLSHIPYAQFLLGSACILFTPAIPDEFCFVVVAQEIQHSNTGFHDLSFVLDFT
jgi:hypothetical protein